jgi:hypothetical protein
VVAFRHGYHGHAGFAALVTGALEEGILVHYYSCLRHPNRDDRNGMPGRLERRIMTKSGGRRRAWSPVAFDSTNDKIAFWKAQRLRREVDKQEVPSV